MHVLFRLYEPMLFRGPMEFSPFVRGPKTVARSLILPTPSTIAGALATLCLDAQKARPPHAGGWEEEVTEVLGLDGALKGPYLLVESNGRGEIYTQFVNHLVMIDEIIRALQSVDRDLKDILISRKKRLREFLEENHVRFYQPVLIERVGIRLEREHKRVVERGGGPYTLQMVDYSKLRSSRGEIVVNKTMDSVSVAVDIHGRSKISNIEKKENILRLGGEGRLSYVMIKEGEPMTSMVRELLTDFRKGEAYIYLITYSLYKSDKNYARIYEACKGGFVAPSILEKVEEVLKRVSQSLRPRYIIGECGILGAGYSISVEARKPIYAALFPGAIIKVEGTKEDLLKLYEEGISEEGSKIGYGTVIPIPIPPNTSSRKVCISKAQS